MLACKDLETEIMCQQANPMEAEAQATTPLGQASKRIVTQGFKFNRCSAWAVIQFMTTESFRNQKTSHPTHCFADTVYSQEHN